MTCLNTSMVNRLRTTRLTTTSLFSASTNITTPRSTHLRLQLGKVFINTGRLMPPIRTTWEDLTHGAKAHLDSRVDYLHSMSTIIGQMSASVDMASSHTNHVTMQVMLLTTTQYQRCAISTGPPLPNSRTTRRKLWQLLPSVPHSCIRVIPS